MREVDRIIRVDHAGEYGAIHIYKTQLLVARIFYKDIVYKLEEMLGHERAHFQTFNQLLEQRNIWHCSALQFLALGGAMLGCITALLGRNAVWVCTNSKIKTSIYV